ncbi:MAG TPA: hypothetical protein PL124_12230 [Candidatus Cloacimonadota bacterium]|nr:hypothetical protein [Candidatus Cloacimonadota bacterium]
MTAPLNRCIKEKRSMEDTSESGSLKGKRYIDELRTNPGKPIHPSKLYNLYQVQTTKYIEDTYRDDDYNPVLDVYIRNNPEAGIPMTDGKTIRSIRTEVKAIMHTLAQARINNDLAKINDCQEELDQCHKYLEECTTPRGRIRETQNLTRRSIATIYRAVEYYYRRLEKTDPKLAKYYSEHVVIGNPCYWSVEPVKRKKQKIA